MRTLFVGLCLLLASFTASGQSDRGTITGTVADPAGAVVAGAPIQAKNVENGAVYDTVSSTTGNYTLAQLPPGRYELSVAVPGFKKYVRQGLTVESAGTIRIDVAIEVGSSSESVTVTEAAPLLKTESGDLSHNVTGDRLNDLPVLGIGATAAGSSGIRNPNAVMQLIPGAYYTANSEVRVNGTPDNTQALRIEGQDATNAGTPGTPAQSQPSVDAIQEITIQTSNFSAEYGQVGGGFFNVTMKSGTNQFHGSAYDYWVNEVLNAGNPYTNNGRGDLLRPRQRRTDYGFTIGGPVWIPKLYNGRDKTFFFFNWEEFRETQQYSTTSQTVPIPAFRIGDFSRASSGKVIGTIPGTTTSILEGQIYDPNTTRTVGGNSIRDPFPGNQIPVVRFDPAAVKIQNLIPLPLGPNANGLTQNFLPSFSGKRVTHIPAVKLDHILSTKDKLSYYWSYTNTANAISTGLGQADGFPDPLTTAIGTFVPAYIQRLNWDHTITPTLLLHVGIGYQSVDQGVPSVNTDGSVRNYDVEKEIGLKGGIVNKFFPNFTGLTFNGGTGGVKNFGSESDTHNYTIKPTANTSLTWVKDNHTYKFGGELRVEGYPAKNFGGAGGSYAFSYAQTSLPYLNGTLLNGTSPGFPYASFLLGLVNNGSIGNVVTPKLGKHQLGFFAQDTWKITRKFTLDYGLRYDYSTYLKEQYGRAPDFSPTTPNPTVGGYPGAVIFEGSGPGHCNCDFAKVYPWGIAPRLGAAYQINQKTVLRLGFGIVYASTEAGNNAAGGLASSTNNFTASPFGSAVTTLSQGIPTSLRPQPWPNTDPGQYPLTATAAPSPLSPPFMDPNAGRPPRQYQWSVGIQRELMRDLAVEAAYVANRGVWWQAPGLLNLNAISLDRLKAAGLDINNPTDVALLTQTLGSAAVTARGFKVPYAGFPTGQTLAQSLRPFPQFTTINAYWSPLGKTWYDSLQLKATKRMSHGLSLLSTFTWSKSLQQGAEREPNPGTTGNASVNDVFNRANNKYLSLHDQPLVLNTSITYVTPKVDWGSSAFGKSASWLSRDWTIGAFLQYASGLPIQAPLAQNNLGTQLFQTTFANRVAGQPLFLKDLNCHCFDPSNNFVLNPAAWTDPPAGQFGTSAAYYGDYRKQRRPQESMNLGRTFRVKERATVNIRMEFTNVFNRARLNDPTSTNAKQALTRNPDGTTSAGFGFIDRTTQTGGTVPAIVNISPRSGVLVARFTF